MVYSITAAISGGATSALQMVAVGAHVSTVGGRNMSDPITKGELPKHVQSFYANMTVP
jgi:hypothetical protein